jgi:hypothetical protein
MTRWVLLGMGAALAGWQAYALATGLQRTISEAVATKTARYGPSRPIEHDEVTDGNQ